MSLLLLKVKFHKPTINKTVFKVKAINTQNVSFLNGLTTSYSYGCVNSLLLLLLHIAIFSELEGLYVSFILMGVSAI